MNTEYRLHPVKTRKTLQFPHTWVQNHPDTITKHVNQTVTIKIIKSVICQAIQAIFVISPNCHVQVTAAIMRAGGWV